VWDQYENIVNNFELEFRILIFRADESINQQVADEVYLNFIFVYISRDPKYARF
jgi:hypothetical protein